MISLALASAIPWYSRDSWRSTRNCWSRNDRTASHANARLGTITAMTKTRATFFTFGAVPVFCRANVPVGESFWRPNHAWGAEPLNSALRPGESQRLAFLLRCRVKQCPASLADLRTGGLGCQTQSWLRKPSKLAQLGNNLRLCLRITLTRLDERSSQVLLNFG